MSFVQEAKKELESLKAWAQEANMQAHLAKAEASAELRTTWMAVEQDAAKLEAKLEDWAEETEESAKEILETLSENYRKLKKSLKS
jgi:hypothetical protein